jgi:hypothetical protein
MSLNVQRDGFDEELGFQYYVSFKPNMDLEDAVQEVHTRLPVEAVLSLSETGDLADFSFALPKTCRSEQALAFIRKQETAQITPTRVSIAVPGLAGDASTKAAAQLDLDLAGRIIGVQIDWIPSDTAIS